MEDGHRSVPGGGDAHDELPEWGAVLVRSVAHLAAQLTTAQIQLRALGDEVEATGTIDPAAVRARQRRLAVLQVGPTLRENLGAALADLIDTDALERDLVDYLSHPGAEPDRPAPVTGGDGGV